MRGRREAAAADTGSGEALGSGGRCGVQGKNRMQLKGISFCFIERKLRKNEKVLTIDNLIKY